MMSIFALLYLVPFCLLFFMPDWRSLLIASVLAFIFMQWATNDARHADGPGSIGAAIFVGATGLGFAAGFIGRVILLCLRHWNAAWAKSYLIGPIIMILVPALVFAYTKYEHAAMKKRNAPPSLACINHLHPAMLATLKLQLPLAPAISVGEGYQYEPHYLFFINKQARKFCAHTQEATPKLTNISISFEQRHGETGSAFCQNTQLQSWKKYACEDHHGKPMTGYPVSMTLYHIGHYNVNMMHATSVDEFQHFQTFEKKLKKMGKTGEYTKYDAGHDLYFVASEKLQAEAHASKLVKCFVSATPLDKNALYCQTGYQESRDIGVIYDFSTTEQNFLTDMKTIHQSVEDIIDSMIVKSS
jgi:hypothetical protein